MVPEQFGSPDLGNAGADELGLHVHIVVTVASAKVTPRPSKVKGPHGGGMRDEHRSQQPGLVFQPSHAGRMRPMPEAPL